MALARALVTFAACFAVAEANNATNATTSTVTTTSSYGAGVTSTVTATTTATQVQETITGTITLTVTGSCQAFVTDPDVKTAMTNTVAAVADVPAGYVDISFSHSCSSRRLSVGRARRLDGTVTVTYTIALPVGYATSGSTISSRITGASTASWTSTLAQKLADAGVTGFTVTVSAVSTPTLGTVLAFTTSTSTTTIQAGVDSSALTTKVLSPAHLWALLAVFAATKLF